MPGWHVRPGDMDVAHQQEADRALAGVRRELRDGIASGAALGGLVARERELAEAARVVHTAYGLDGDTEAVVYAGTGR